jgi:hypothetical protein
MSAKEENVLDLQIKIKTKYFSRLCAQIMRDPDDTSLHHEIIMELVRKQIIPYTAKVYVDILYKEALDVAKNNVCLKK